MKSVEQQLSESQAEVKSLKEAHTAVITSKDVEIKTLKESVSVFKKSTVTAEVNAAITEAKLPEAAANYIRAQYKDKETSELLKEAIDAVKPHVQVVRNNGSQAVVVEGAEAKAKAELKESLKRAFPRASEKEIQDMCE